MKHILVLEDNSGRIKQFKECFAEAVRVWQEGVKVYYVDTAAKAIELLEVVPRFDMVFLDHDLDEMTMVDVSEENTGSGVARWMKDNYADRNIEIVIHSFNEDGAKNIMLELRGYDIKWIPGIWSPAYFGKTFLHQ